ncbi:MAG: type I-G CRISPR-associated helicase/endonuclease Cas3g [Bacillota bacterium]|jgi:CRISPR-associated endonuclease/helicase Cas3|nr:CRISPR-associated helicase Cas3' [Candidatus Fermentithermobacillaceae bacterium]
MTVYQTFDDFFRAGTGKDPYCYQRELALMPELPEALIVPTGAGKTLAVALAWLWRRRFEPHPERRNNTPRRLVYCLPMRTLVSQTAESIRDCLRALGILSAGDGADANGVSVHILMGGDADDSWMRTPERDVVLVGTQDMLLSRALNRGYGVSRFRWPPLFGLLSNDCLWVFDEIQLMGSGLYTSAQLDAFRSSHGIYGKTPSLWMSATAEPDWLQTINRRAPEPSAVMRLGAKDAGGPLEKRLNARKVLRKAGTAPRFRRKADLTRYAATVAGSVLKHHVHGDLTLVVCNTVERALAVYREVIKAGPEDEVLLIHSRFRPAERLGLESQLQGDRDRMKGGRIVISTQVVEAGVDLSSRTLITEIAPWSSLVQRWGRNNRAGEYAESDILWFDLSDDDCLPYSAEELARSRVLLEKLEGDSVSPSKIPALPEPYEPRFAFRHRDFLELFDTTPDITGTDIDVSRFVRGQDDPDVGVFWRNWSDTNPPGDMAAPGMHEICSVPVGELQRFMRGSSSRQEVWKWDHISGQWERAGLRDIYPGQVFLLKASLGGYSTTEGWCPDSVDPVTDLRDETKPAPDHWSQGTYDNAGAWVSLREHSDNVVSELQEILDGLGDILPRDVVESLRVAARWHDLGKAHCVFQNALVGPLPEPERAKRSTETWAKKPRTKRRTTYSRRHFRHELASALAVLHHLGDSLIAYLVASHHGRVRGVIRSIATETVPGNGKRYALGVWDGDPPLPETDLGGLVVPPTVLSLECMELGMGASGHISWIDRVADLLLRRDLGPFRLAYLESLLIAADWAASSKEGGDKPNADDHP